ncbi:MAG: type III-B CRISPR module RAMP protein Cmr6 [Rhodopirellula sp.]|nr:type III-B CRISPR module RAMP protein Cmr6 [Rhodopirellula sp.]
MTNDLISPLPESTRRLLRHNSHPGLLLDKYAESWDPSERLDKLSEKVQGPTIGEVVRLTSEAPRDFYRELIERRRKTLADLGALLLEAQTTSSLALHLSRASSLENAGICLHRVYGFAYLPGTSLKGMARAYAETVWFPTQFEADPPGSPRDDGELDKATAAWRKIEAVFGYSPGSDRDKSWKPKRIPARQADDPASIGGVVFHDAWPVSWAALVKDILNCHHPKYYQEAQSPGDWEDPIPVYFLAVPAGQSFQFALSRRGEAAGEWVELASQWLLGGLISQGAGAKTSSGYGAFRVTALPPAAEHLPAAAETAWRTAVDRQRVAEFSGLLTLTTPAFLAGAEHSGEPGKRGCDLRPATLRGLLRWWWRTMHVGFLDARALNSLEAAIWGDTEAGAAVRIVLEQRSAGVAEEYNFKDHFDPQRQFKRDHALGDRPNQKTTQGLFYASYGMDERSGGQSRHRYFLEPGAQWSVRLIAKPSHRGGRSMTAAEVLAQAEAALWLMCRFGACGSKARKGFGSLCLTAENVGVDSLEKCQFVGGELRAKLGLNNRFEKSLAESAALAMPQQNWCSQIEVPVPSADAWQVMDHVGFAYQAVAQQFKHDPRKASLGLPRKIHGPRGEAMPNQDRSKWQRPKPLESSRPGRSRDPQKDRYASPVWIHVDREGEHHVVRAIAFPAAFLPDLKRSDEFLKEFLAKFQAELQGPLRPCSGIGERPGRGPQPLGRPSGSPSPPAAASQAAGLPNTGDQVEAELLEERTKKGGWRARHVASGIAGPIQNGGDVPGDKKAGDRLPLIVQSANPKEIAFKYPTEAILKQLENTKSKQRGKGPGRGRGGR